MKKYIMVATLAALVLLSPAIKSDFQKDHGELALAVSRTEQAARSSGCAAEEMAEYKQASDDFANFARRTPLHMLFSDSLPYREETLCE